MRILQINSVYKVGSTGKIVDCIGNVLRKHDNDVFTCYGIGESYIDQYSQKICTTPEHMFNALLSRIRGIAYGGVYYSNIKIKRIIRKFNPDIVHIHCINANMINVYSLLKFLAKNNIKTVITLHAEFFYTAGCEHACECNKFKSFCNQCNIYKSKVGSYFLDRSYKAWKLMNEAFSFFHQDNIIITAVSPWLADRAVSSTILNKFKVKYVPNGIDTDIFYPKVNNGLIQKVDYKKQILFVTPYYSEDTDDLKGGRFISQIAKSLKDYKFIVVASRVSHHLKARPTNVQLWGRAKSQEELAQLYSESDLTIILSKRESFSMVTVESLCCGTPVAGFKAGGPETIAIEEYSNFVTYGKLDLLIEAINLILHRNIDRDKLALIAKQRYSKENMANLYSMVYNELIH